LYQGKTPQLRAGDGLSTGHEYRSYTGSGNARSTEGSQKAASGRIHSRFPFEDSAHSIGNAIVYRLRFGNFLG